MRAQRRLVLGTTNRKKGAELAVLLTPVGLDIRTLAVMHRIRHDMEWYQLKALSNVVNGKVDIKSLMTHEFPLSKAKEAFDCAINDPTACKVMLRSHT